MLGGENLPCSLTQANSSLTVEMPLLMKMNVVGEADNKLKGNEIDSTKFDLDGFMPGGERRVCCVTITTYRNA